MRHKSGNIIGDIDICYLVMIKLYILNTYILSYACHEMV